MVCLAKFNPLHFSIGPHRTSYICLRTYNTAWECSKPNNGRLEGDGNGQAWLTANVVILDDRLNLEWIEQWLTCRWMLFERLACLIRSHFMRRCRFDHHRVNLVKCPPILICSTIFWTVDVTKRGSILFIISHELLLPCYHAQIEYTMWSQKICGAESCLYHVVGGLVC